MEVFYMYTIYAPTTLDAALTDSEYITYYPRDEIDCRDNLLSFISKQHVTEYIGYMRKNRAGEFLISKRVYGIYIWLYLINAPAKPLPTFRNFGPHYYPASNSKSPK